MPTTYSNHITRRKFMDKWIKDIGAWKDYGLILVAIAIFTGILPVMALVKWGLLAWIAANLWQRFNK
tara:strand:- start:261 stop:461 length:201 start_codon:yes stop_codon:yes gene_type:complete